MRRFYVLLIIVFISLMPVMPVFSGDSTLISFNSTANTHTPNQFYPPAPIYPDYGATPKTSKLKTTVNGQGMIGRSFHNTNTGSRNWGFEFPTNTDVKYMRNAGLWVGGIVDGDTLVSTSYCKEVVYTPLYPYTTFETDFHPPLIDNDTASTTFFPTDDGEIFHTTFADTFIPIYTGFSSILDTHKSMGLQVTLKTYTKNIPPFKNIILLDYIITNTSSKIINSAYAGIFVDESVYSDCNPTYEPDDLVGSFRDKGIVYAIDNDGDLNVQSCQNQPPSGAMALKTMAIYPTPRDTIFNWWTNRYYYTDEYIEESFGPRKKGTDENPYRDIGYGEYGAPYGDSNRYYIMSQPAWDFDQYLTKQITQSDSSWLTLGDSIMTEISNGDDMNFLLTMGPYDLLPDSSIRAVFALMGTEFVHLNKNNYLNLLNENYDEYYNNLYFDILFDNIRLSKVLTDEYLDPLNQPYGFKAKPLSESSYLLNWDQYVFPEVIGYNLYLKEIPDEYLLSQNVVRPNIDFETLPTELKLYTLDKNELQIDNLLPGKSYLAVVAHTTVTEEGKLSKPVILGTNNPFTKPAKVKLALEFAPIDPKFKSVTLKWNYPENSNIDYFKIYKAKDSISAQTRHSPFLYPRTADIPFSPKYCFNLDDSSICYYEWNHYASVSSDKHHYTISSDDEGVYYWITAVNKYGVESELSPLIKTIPTPEITKDIVVLYGSSISENDYVYEDSLKQFFDEIFDGYNYDLFNWSDTIYLSINCTTGTCINWEDLANYKLIVINEYPNPRILTSENESYDKLFTRLSDLGNNIAFFGIPSGSKKVSLSNYVNTISYDYNSFEKNYMGIAQTHLISWLESYQRFSVFDTLAGFNKAIPNFSSLPEILLKKEPTFYKPFIKQLFAFDDYVPLVPVFEPTENSAVLYTFQSAFPQTSLLQGKPVGIKTQNKNNQIYSFGFHLWALEKQSAKSLIQYLFNKQSQHSPNYTIPRIVTLNQNYPNPFNASTTISFSLPATYNVTLDLFNILGQKIKTLLPLQELPIGNHRVTWDGNNELNKPVSTGIYFYQLKIDEYTFTNKMVYLK